MSIEKAEDRMGLPLINSPEVSQWFDKAFEDPKKLTVNNEFESETESAFEDLNSPINISRFGFKTPNDLKIFMLSPAGDTVKAEMSERIAHEEAIAEKTRRDYLDKQARDERLKATLLLWMLSKDAHAKAKLREFADDYVKSLHEKQQKEPSVDTKKQEARAKEFDVAMKSCENAFKTAEERLNTLNDQVENFKKQEQNYHLKSEMYTQAMEEFDAKSEEYLSEGYSKEKLASKIKQLEEEVMSMAEEVMSLSLEDEDAARALMERQNTKNLELASLRDLRDVKNSDDKKKFKQYVDENGAKTQSSKDAAFIIGSSQELIKDKTNDKYYLIPKGADRNDPEVRRNGEKAFDKAKDEILLVKKVVDNTLKAEKAFHQERIQTVTTQRDTAKVEKDLLQNQLNTMRSVHDNLAKQSPELETAPKPMPSGASKPVFPVDPSPTVKSVLKKMLEVFKTPNLSSKRLFDEVDKQPDAKKHPKTAEETKEFLRKVLTMFGLKDIPSLAPLPKTTMDFLLKTMDRFGKDQYQVNRGLAKELQGVSLQNAPKRPETGGPKLEVPLSSDKTKEAPSTAPSPFKTSPTMIPK